MKSVFIAGSRKFFPEIEQLVQLLKQSNIQVATSGKWDSTQEDTFESEKDALLRAFKEINNSDIIYILANKGYVGKTVAMEIAYAYAKNKTIISSQEIEEFSARSLINNILNKEQLIQFCK